MSAITRQIIAEAETLPPEMQEQLLNFVEFLAYKQQKAESILSNCELKITNTNNVNKTKTDG